MKLLSDNPANLACADHPVYLAEAGPHYIIRLSGQQHDVLQLYLLFQAVEVIKGVPVPLRSQKLKFPFLCPDPRFLKQLPDNGLPAGLPCLGGTSGIFPGSGKAFSLCPAGQQQMTPAIINSDTDHKAEFSGIPVGTPLMNPAGQLPVLIIDIVELHRAAPLFIRFCVQSSTAPQKWQ